MLMYMEWSLERLENDAARHKKSFFIVFFQASPSALFIERFGQMQLGKNYLGLCTLPYLPNWSSCYGPALAYVETVLYRLTDFWANL